jgi:hypothetical protein
LHVLQLQFVSLIQVFIPMMFVLLILMTSLGCAREERETGASEETDFRGTTAVHQRHSGPVHTYLGPRGEQ